MHWRYILLALTHHSGDDIQNHKINWCQLQPPPPNPQPWNKLMPTSRQPHRVHDSGMQHATINLDSGDNTWQLDSFTVPLHSPKGRHFACHLGRAKGLSLGSEKRWGFPLLTWAHNAMGTRKSQFIFRPANHKRVMPANWRPCLIPHWESYYHQVSTV